MPPIQPLREAAYCAIRPRLGAMIDGSAMVLLPLKLSRRREASRAIIRRMLIAKDAARQRASSLSCDSRD